MSITVDQAIERIEGRVDALSGQSVRTDHAFTEVLTMLHMLNMICRAQETAILSLEARVANLEGRR